MKIVKFCDYNYISCLASYAYNMLEVIASSCMGVCISGLLYSDCVTNHFQFSNGT